MTTTPTCDEQKKHREIQDHMIEKLEEYHDQPEKLREHFIDSAIDINLNVQPSGKIDEITLTYNVSGGRAFLDVYHGTVTSKWTLKRSYTILPVNRREKALETIKNMLEDMYKGVELH